MTAGDKIGPYEILALAGADGMGEVWKARDTRLGRIIAIKVSKERFSENFEREAQGTYLFILRKYALYATTLIHLVDPAKYVVPKLSRLDDALQLRIGRRQSLLG